MPVLCLRPICRETFQNAIAVDNFNKDISDIYKSIRH